MTAKNFKDIRDKKRGVLLDNPDKCAVPGGADSHLVDELREPVEVELALVRVGKQP